MGELLGGAGLGLLGGYIQNQYNSEQVANQEGFQMTMSDTAYQRQVQDMKAAGLNPMFAVGSGGASSPAGSVAQQTSPISTGLQGAQQAQSMQNAAQNQDNQNKTTTADVALKGAQALQAAAQTKNLGLDSSEKKVQSRIYDGINSAIDTGKRIYKSGRDLFQSNSDKTGTPIQFGTPDAITP